MFQSLSDALSGRETFRPALPPCEHRLIATDAAFPLRRRPELQVDCSAATLFRWGDMLGDYSGFDLGENPGVLLEHGGSRLGAYSATHRDIHDRSLTLAERLLDASGFERRDGEVAALLYCADELFKFMTKAAAVETIAADSAFDQIVLVQNRSCRLLDLCLRLTPQLRDRIWLTWADPSPEAEAANRRGLTNVLTRYAAGTSALRQQLAKLTTQNRGNRPRDAGSLWEGLRTRGAASPAMASAQGAAGPALLLLAPGSRSVDGVLAPVADHLARRFSLDLALQNRSAPAAKAEQVHHFGAPDDEALSVYATFSAALMDCVAGPLASLYTEAPVLETTALDLRVPTLLKRDLPHLIAHSGRLERIIDPDRHMAVLAFGARSPWATAGLEAARCRQVPSVMVELNAITADYPRYISARSDYVAVGSVFAADLYAKHFGLAPSRLAVVGTPDLVQVTPPNESRRILFIAQPVTEQLAWSAWRMVIQAVAQLGWCEAMFRRHPLQDRAVERCAARLAAEAGVKAIFSDPADPIMDVLATVQAVTTCFSTVGLQAAWAGLPTIICTPQGARLPQIAGKDRPLPTASSAGALAEALLAVQGQYGDQWRASEAARQAIRSDFPALIPELVTVLIKQAVADRENAIRAPEAILSIPLFIAPEAGGLAS
jgi:hypothetical protein